MLADRIIATLLAFALVFFPALASAQMPNVHGFPLGTFQNRSALDGTVAATYQGPGDVVGSATAWGSCARVYQASLASTSTSMCDLVDATTGTVVIGTLRGSSTGQVDLSAYFAGAVTPATACAAAAGGACKIKKVYDQAGATGGWTQATAANMPTVTFSALNGLPSINCSGGTNPVMSTTGNVTTTQPYTFSVVFESTSAISTQGISGGAAAAAEFIGTGATNGVGINAGTTVNVAGAAINTFHAAQGVLSGASSIISIDGTDTTGLSAGTGVISSAALRLCRNGSGGASLIGSIMEIGLWNLGFTSGAGNQTLKMNSNQHGVNGYNF